MKVTLYLFVIIQLFILGEFGLCNIQTIQNLVLKNLKTNLFKVSKCPDEKLTWVTTTSDDLQTLVEKLFKKLKQVIEGNDPYLYDDITPYNTDGYGLINRGSIGKLVIKGTSSMNVTHLVATNKDILHFELELDFKEIEITGFYNFTFDFLTMLPLFGQGDFGLIVPSLTINTKMDLKQTQSSNILQITESTFELKIADFEVDLENLLGDETYSKLVTGIINDISEDLASQDEYLNKILNIVIPPKLNDVLCSYQVTYDKMIDFITHFIQ